MTVSNLFKIPYNAHFLACDSNANGPADLLLLHGGGVQTDFRCYSYLRHDLFAAGITSLAFDFVGHGLSHGDLAHTTLADRTQQTHVIAHSGHLKHPLTLIGLSMGGYTALKMTELFPVETLILFVPAAYAKDAYQARFQDEFTRIICQPLSWQQSDAWEIMERFTGSLLLIDAENDEVIPREIPQRLFAAAKNTKQKHYHVVPNSPHKIIDYLNESPIDRQVVVDIIKNLNITIL